MYDVFENEHQELFYPGVDPRRPVAIHIPSPLGPLPYHVLVRVPGDQVDTLAQVSLRIDVDGLHEDHLDIPAGAGLSAPRLFPSREPGLVWFTVAVMHVSRGNGTLVFHHWPAELSQVDLLLCTWPRFVAEGGADIQLAAMRDASWTCSGVPLGGIGAGKVDICRDGRWRNYGLNNNQDAPLEAAGGVPGLWLGVSEADVYAALTTSPVDRVDRCCPQLEFEARFPHAMLRQPGVLDHLDVEVLLSGSLQPHDVVASSRPGFMMRWRFTNHASADRRICAVISWPNLTGLGGGVGSAESGIGQGNGLYRHWDERGERFLEPVERDQWFGMMLLAGPLQHQTSAGRMLLAVRRQPGVRLLYPGALFPALVEIELPAGEMVDVHVVLVPFFKHFQDSLGVSRGHYYSNTFSSPEDIADAWLSDPQAEIQKTGALVDLLRDSSLPDWASRRLSNCTYPLVSNSVLFQDGRFSINEGPTEMIGCYGTIDQRLAAHPAMALLFPDLNAQELRQFAAIQGAEGGIQHDLGTGHLERGPGETTWPDLTCSFILQCARHAWTTGDTAFEQEMWPRARLALLRHARWAEEGQGVAQVGSGLGTSYDGYHYIGTTGYMGTLWLAVLAVMEVWAGRAGDQELGPCIQRWREQAKARLTTDLWNGSHFIAYGSPSGPRRETCHAGQLAGQFFSSMLAGEDVVDQQELEPCREALLRLNGDPRHVVPPDEVNLDGTAATTFGWLPYVEGFMLTAVAGSQPDAVWDLWERMMRAVDGDGAHPCDTRLMYRPESGEPSWGNSYMTAPASWLVYESLLDFWYQPDPGFLRLRPGLRGRYPLVHPLFWATVQAEAGNFRLSVNKVWSSGPVTVRYLELPSTVKAVRSGGHDLPPEPGRGRYHWHQLPVAFTLAPGAEIEWSVEE